MLEANLCKLQVIDLSLFAANWVSFSH